MERVEDWKGQQMRKIATLLTFGVGFLLGSKAGHKPYEKFMGVMGRLRQTKVVARPIESTADRVSGAVRDRGIAIADKVADATYRSIAGSGPVVIEARLVDVNKED